MMTKNVRTVVALLFALPLYLTTSLGSQPNGEAGSMTSKLFSFTVKTIDGKERSLSEYKGKVVLIVNVASECGYTPQYKDLQEIYLKYKDKGFVILGFPSNNFGQQEPGTDPEIKQFCETKYNVTFDLFSKIEVKGNDQAPLYKYLTTECEVPHEITWNFNKFLVDRSGKVVDYFPSKVKPTDAALTNKIEELLAPQN
jgi:glutathione peroxidase-family protein